MPLEQLRPTSKPRMMDLVEQAGIDITPWGFRADGTAVDVPAANPAYCYEWCFSDPHKVVLNLWFDRLLMENGRVLQRVNMRDLRRRVEAAKHLDSGARSAAVRRAMAVDTAVQRAFRDRLHVRAIVCDGDKRDLDDPSRRDPSRVELRLLDPSPWRVTEYDWMGGAAVIVRDEPLDEHTSASG
jgi:5-methylcytosine-specific restriction enzyme A